MEEQAREPGCNLAVEESRRHTIGYALEPKKKNSFIQPSLVNLARDYSIIDLAPINASPPLLKPGQFNCGQDLNWRELLEWTDQLTQPRSGRATGLCAQWRNPKNAFLFRHGSSIMLLVKMQPLP